MKPNLQQKAVRKVGAALLDAEFSCAELQEIGESVLHDHVFQRDLAAMIKHLWMALGSGEDAKAPTRPADLAEFRRTWFQRTYRILQRKRKSKKEIGALIATVRPGIDASLDYGQTVREMLVQFARQASVNDCDAFEQALQRSADDPYLQGIMRRSEGNP